MTAVGTSSAQGAPTSDNIASATTACRQSLERCTSIKSLRDHGWAENRLADFNVWDSGLGASSSRRASLEDRLALKPHVRTAVLNLLIIYQSAIELVIDLGILHDERENSNADGKQGPGTIGHGDIRTAESLSAGEELIVDDSTLPEAIENADMVLNDLARLAALIRKAGTSSRLFRADATFDPRMQKHGELRQHLIQLLLCRPSQLEDRRHAHWDSIDPSLTNMPLEGRDAYWNRLDQERVDLSHVNNELTDIQERLVVANLRRSHRFAYSQKHGSKLESSSQPFKPIINMIQTGLTAESPMSKWDMPTGPKPGAVNEPAQMHSDQMGTPDYGAENMTDTVASDVETAVIKDVEKKPTPSQQAATEISTTGSRLRYPKPPRCKPGLVLFTCPCCCLPLPMIFADSRRWRKHLKEDVLPYTCVLSNCPEPATLFAEKSAWLDHMFNDHEASVTWVCDICGDTETHTIEADFIKHLTQIHQGAIPADQVTMFTEMCEQRTVEEISSCPLCSWTEDADGFVTNDLLLEHVAEHIHSFALRSLPWAPDKDDHDRITFERAFEKVEDWFAACNPDAESSDYKSTLPSAKPTKDLDQYFLTHEYFGESSRASSLAPTVSSDEWDEDEDEDEYDDEEEDWATFHKVTKEAVEKAGRKEVERQNILHEIVQGEDNYIKRLDVLRLLYRDRLLSAQPPVIPPKKIDKFVRDVFSKVDAVWKANEDHLRPQIKYRQREQGPWIVGFSDIFREWIRKARQAYIEYAASFPYAKFLVGHEAEKNILFRRFLDEAQADKRSNKLDYNMFLKAPIARLQRYGLLIDMVIRNSLEDNEEKRNLIIAKEEIKMVALECDARVGEMTRKVDLTELQQKILLRPGMQRVELNLDHLGRELIFRGELHRMGTTRFNWLETQALLFDHYLVLAKAVTVRRADGVVETEKYDVSRLPIPMDLLVLESEDDDPVKRSTMKGIATVNPAADKVRSGGMGRSVNSPGPGMLQNTNRNTSFGSANTGGSGKTAVNNNALENKDDKILYPFKVTHLGKETYTLFATSANNRAEWCDKLIIAKTRHAAALFAQNAEPFRLRVMADSAFAYDSAMPSQKAITIKGTPLDRAVEEVEKLFLQQGRPPPICRARVNCATAFNQPYGNHMLAVGTDIGVYVSEFDNPRGWSKAVQIPRVTQIAVLEQYSLMLLISDKSLIAYHLDAVCPVGGAPPSNDSARRAPQKLSGARDIGFFATGVMKDRTLVFYKKKDDISSTFKVLEPVFQKSTDKKSRIWKSGRTEFFREYDEFYIPADCYTINLFHESLAVSTAKGFEVLTLDKKQPWSVPDLKQPHVATFAARLATQNPLGMFRLSDQEFLLCYEECAVYINKNGDISRSVIMEFVGKAKSAAMYGPYVLLFDPDFVEIRNAQNGRLRQVIAGRDVKCLDDRLSGGSEGRTVKLSLQHPVMERCQVVVELVLNEGQKE